MGIDREGVSLSTNKIMENTPSINVTGLEIFRCLKSTCSKILFSHGPRSKSDKSEPANVLWMVSMESILDRSWTEIFQGFMTKIDPTPFALTR